MQEIRDLITARSIAFNNTRMKSFVFRLCKSKRPYVSREQAILCSSKNQHEYHCEICSKWHLGSWKNSTTGEKSEIHKMVANGTFKYCVDTWKLLQRRKRNKR